MSKRFGRNQKRAMREQIKASEASRAMDRGLIAEQGRKLRDAEDYQRSVARIVGENAIAAGKPSMMQMTAYGDFQIAPRGQPRMPSYMHSHPVSMDAVRAETMRLLHIDVIRDITATQLHCRVMLKDKKAGYAISDLALMQMSKQELRHVIHREIADGLARLLVDEITA